MKKLLSQVRNYLHKLLHRPKEPNRIQRLVKWLIIISMVLIGLLILAYMYIAYFLPLPDYLNNISDLPATKIFDRRGQLLYEVLRPDLGKKTNITLAQIPKTFINATLSAEDINFYSHPGVDAIAIFRAIFYNIKEQRVVSGASTITQQLIRNLMGNPKDNSGRIRERNLWDKSLEAIYAIRLSNKYSKDQILELYLNRVYYGNMAYGAESAALDYFGQHIYDLDLAQQAFIAGLPQSPSYYNPFVNFDRAKSRQKYVLEQMVKYSFISKEQSETAQNEPLKLRSNKYQIKAPHFVHYVVNRVEEEYGEDTILNGGLQITTTLDYNLQLNAEQIIKRQIDHLNKNNVNNGALLAVDVKTGQILVWVGSADYFNEKIDGYVDMVTALRQPGSSIKPLTYLMALEKGYTPATIIFDIPTQFNTEIGTYTPKNYDLDYHGPVRVRTALASSYNIPAVKTLEYVGVSNFIDFLRTLGIGTLNAPPSFYGLALTLGGGEVRILDMATAFNVIANYGYKKENSPILEVKDAKGNYLYQWKPPVEDFVLGSKGKEHAYQIIDILKDPLARIPGFGTDNILELSHEAAVKTGTTRNFRDNWTIGFTPQILTAVWVGNADASPMENVSGVDGAAPIWAEFMEAALQFKPKIQFYRPPNVIQMEICALSGRLPTENCPDRIYEWFVKGQQPEERDDYYRSFWINRDSGKIIQDACADRYNKASLEQKVLVAYPAELQKWASSKGLQLPQIEPCNLPFAYPTDYPNDKAHLSQSQQSDQNSTSGDYPNGYPVNKILVENPVENDEYLLDSIMPLKDQKVPFRVTVPLNTISVEYFVDGISVGKKSDSPYTYLWLPTKGRHELKAVAHLADGSQTESGKITFFVK